MNVWGSVSDLAVYSPGLRTVRDEAMGHWRTTTMIERNMAQKINSLMLKGGVRLELKTVSEKLRWWVIDDFEENTKVFIGENIAWHSNMRDKWNKSSVLSFIQDSLNIEKCHGIVQRRESWSHTWLSILSSSHSSLHSHSSQLNTT